MPHEMISSIVHKFFPSLERRIKRTVTIPVTRTFTSQHVEGGQQQTTGPRPVGYITFNASVGRNSTFHDLTHEQIEELCGIEFKALNCLVWIVPCVRSIYYPIITDADCLLPHSTIWSSRLSHSLSSRPTCPSQSGNKAFFLPTCIPIFPQCGECCMAARRALVNSLQVLVVPGYLRIHEYWDVTGGPIYGPLPTSLPYDYHPGLSDYYWEHGICESYCLGSQ